MLTKHIPHTQQCGIVITNHIPYTQKCGTVLTKHTPYTQQCGIVLTKHIPYTQQCGIVTTKHIPYTQKCDSVLTKHIPCTQQCGTVITEPHTLHTTVRHSVKKNTRLTHNSSVTQWTTKKGTAFYYRKFPHTHHCTSLKHSTETCLGSATAKRSCRSIIPKLIHITVSRV